MFEPKTMDFSKITTFSAQNRHNLVRIDNLRSPGMQEDNLFQNEEFDILVEKLKEAKAAGRTVTCTPHFFSASMYWSCCCSAFS